MEKNILVLRDGRTGNFKQAQTAAKILSGCLRKKGIISNIDIQVIEYKNKLAKAALIFYTYFAYPFSSRVCLGGLRALLKKETCDSLSGKRADFVISGGASVALVNVILSRVINAKSIAVMKPPTVDLNRFDLVIMPRHDNPPKRKNIVVTEGALNLIDQDYLRKQTAELVSNSTISNASAKLCIGLLIGGDTKSFHLNRETISSVINEIKSSSKDLGADILVSTSRRTSRDIEELVKKEFADHPSCKFLVIANEKNIPQAVGAILGLSHIVVISPESIMMISEAVNSKKNVLVFESEGLSRKHRRFLENFSEKRYIYLFPPSRLDEAIKDISLNKKEACVPLRDEQVVEDALVKVI